MQMLYNRQHALISIWLTAMCVAIVAMIFIGGLTRLTESGLSITEWNPISGILPPMDEACWDKEFEKYQQSPEYIKNNSGMNMDEFKSIYILEYSHRLAGRVTSLLYLLPLMFFFISGHIKGRDAAIYIFALVLLSMQGVMGWYMVQSGLASNPYVSHYRLAGHLMLAVFLYIILFWQLMKNSFDIMLLPSGTSLKKVKFWCLVSIKLLLVQIMFGAFVAGLDAGLVYNSFPFMGEGFIPHEVSESTLSLASFGEPVFVQFIHRIIAYILFVAICIFCMHGISLQSSKFTKGVGYVFAALILQMLLGIATLVLEVPIPLALLHQLGAVFFLTCLLWTYFLIKSSDNV